MRGTLRSVLSAVHTTAAEYLQRAYAGVSEDGEAIDLMALRTASAAQVGAMKQTQAQFEALWLDGPPDVERQTRCYGAARFHAAADLYRSGVFAPLLPPLRPGFSSALGGKGSEEDALSAKDFGKLEAWTPGTFGVFFTCSHRGVLLLS